MGEHTWAETIKFAVGSMILGFIVLERFCTSCANVRRWWRKRQARRQEKWEMQEFGPPPTEDETVEALRQAADEMAKGVRNSSGVGANDESALDAFDPTIMPKWAEDRIRLDRSSQTLMNLQDMFYGKPDDDDLAPESRDNTDSQKPLP